MNAPDLLTVPHHRVGRRRHPCPDRPQVAHPPPSPLAVVPPLLLEEHPTLLHTGEVLHPCPPVVAAAAAEVPPLIMAQD